MITRLALALLAGVLIQSPLLFAQQNAAAEAVLLVDADSVPAQTSDGENIEIFVPADQIIEQESTSDTEALRDAETSELETVLQSFHEMDETRLQRFLSRKKWVMDRVAKTLTHLKLPETTASRILQQLNRTFLRSAKLFAESKVKGGGLLLNVPVGLALSTELENRLRAQPLGRFLPKNLGFYYAFGFGVAMNKVVVDSRARMRLELFVELNRLKSVKTFIAKLGIQANVSVIFESRSGEDLVKQVLQVSELPGVTIRRGEQHFSVSTGPSLSLPPFIQGLSVFESQGTRTRLISIEIANLHPSVWFAKIAERLKQPARMSRPLCRTVLSAY